MSDRPPTDNYMRALLLHTFGIPSTPEEVHTQDCMDAWWHRGQGCTCKVATGRSGAEEGQS